MSYATISSCGLYRYWLERKWASAGLPQVFVMLNPSTADATKDDPTIRRCINFAKREGATSLIVVNLFALRATDPKALNGVSDFAIGPDNNENIELALMCAATCHKPVICAWGANKNAPPRASALIHLADDLGVNLVCLGTTKAGAPKHPLYLKADAPLVPFPAPEVEETP